MRTRFETEAKGNSEIAYYHRAQPLSQRMTSCVCAKTGEIRAYRQIQVSWNIKQILHIYEEKCEVRF